MLKKSKKWKSRISAGFLAAVMALTMLPGTVFAADASDKQSAGSGGDPVVLADDTGASGIELSKSAVLENDGTYTINLAAYATGKIVTSVREKPTDVVLVLDVSGSMEDDFTYVTGWQYVEDLETRIGDCPDKTLYHKCPDGTYSTITWTETGNKVLGVAWGTWRYVCDHCKATRKWSNPAYQTLGDSDDSWNLYQYTATTETKSRIEALQEAANSFIDNVAEKNASIENTANQHRVSLVKFASESVNSSIGNNTYTSGRYTYNYTQTVAGLTTVNASTAETLKGSVSSLVPGGATAADKGLGLAKNVLADSGSDRAKIVILFTDGEPTYGSEFQNTVASDAVTTAGELKKAGTTIYTIGTMSGANSSDTSDSTNRYMNAVSSNYPDAAVTNRNNFTVNLGNGGDNGYYKVVNDSAELENIFEEISESVGTETVELDASSVTKDILGDGFKLPDDYNLNNITVESVKYEGRDRNGNRQFASNGTALSVDGLSETDGTINYTGFDFAGECLIDGTEIVDEFTPAVQGAKLVITIKGVEATDAAVTNSLTNTNNINSGIYENAQAEIPAARFPQPKTQLSSKAYVVDYAKEIKTEDLPNTVTNLSAGGMNKFTSAATALNGDQLAYGTATTNSYKPTTTNWDGYDSYYAFGQWKTMPEGVTTGNNTWTKVSVIPANNVYYEDDFITNEATGTVGIEYTGNWSVDGTSSNNAETPNTDVHGGWQNGDLADDATYSDGSAHYADAKDGAATATFTFTGSGVDVYSRTNMTTGYVRAQLYKGESTTAAALTKSLIVDNLAESGDYYQIPTVSFTGLDHGTYTVKLTVASKSDDRSTYYIDGIRVYNPLSSEQEADSTVSDAYSDEIGAVFTEVRDILIDSASVDDEGNGKLDGVVFLDKDGDSTKGTYSVGEYLNYGPKHEVYLAKDQAIAIVVGDIEGKISIGLKAPEGEAAAQITNGAGKSDLQINAASDLYYEVTPNGDGYIIIQNNGDNLLAVTKLKMSGMGDLAEFSLQNVLTYANEFSALRSVAYVQEPSDDQPEIDTPSDTEDGDVVIDNPTDTPDEDDTSDTGKPIVNWINKLINGFKNLFSRW